MRILEAGHTFALHSLDGGQEEILRFVKRQGERYPGNNSAHPGTTVQEVCRALIARLQYVNEQQPHVANNICISALRTCIWLLEKRAADINKRVLRAEFHTIELEQICKTCGHIGCHRAPKEHESHAEKVA